MKYDTQKTKTSNNKTIAILRHFSMFVFFVTKKNSQHNTPTHKNRLYLMGDILVFYDRNTNQIIDCIS